MFRSFGLQGGARRISQAGDHVLDGLGRQPQKGSYLLELEELETTPVTNPRILPADMGEVQRCNKIALVGLAADLQQTMDLTNHAIWANES